MTPLRRTALYPEGCLFCRRHDGGFEAEEHIFSYALGNRAYVLPPGVVCDRCNTGPLQAAERALISFHPIELLRAERGLTTRRGEKIVATTGGTRIWWPAPGELRILPAGKKVVRRTGLSSGSMSLTGNVLTDRVMRLITHAVWKTALEDLCRRHGAELAFNARFDPVRESVIGQRNSRGWCCGRKTVSPHDWVAVSVDFAGENRVPVTLDVFGVAFHSDLIALNLDPGEIVPPWPANVWTFGDGRATRGVKEPQAERD